MSGKTLAAAAAAAGMSERTARKWQSGALPSTAKAPRTWRTREDPFADVWQSEVVPQLVADTDARLQVLWSGSRAGSAPVVEDGFGLGGMAGRTGDRATARPNRGRATLPGRRPQPCWINLTGEYRWPRVGSTGDANLIPSRKRPAADRARGDDRAARAARHRRCRGTRPAVPAIDRLEVWPHRPSEQRDPRRALGVFPVGEDAGTAPSCSPASRWLESRPGRWCRVRIVPCVVDVGRRRGFGRSSAPGRRPAPGRRRRRRWFSGAWWRPLAAWAGTPGRSGPVLPGRGRARSR